MVRGGPWFVSDGYFWTVPGALEKNIFSTVLIDRATKWGGGARARTWASCTTISVAFSFQCGTSTWEMKKACHFGPLPSLPWPLGHVRLISFLSLVCAAALLCSSSLPVSLLIPALRGLS